MTKKKKEKFSFKLSYFIAQWNTFKLDNTSSEQIADIKRFNESLGYQRNEYNKQGMGKTKFKFLGLNKFIEKKIHNL